MAASSRAINPRAYEDCQKHVSLAWISNDIPHTNMESISLLPVSGTLVPICIFSFFFASNTDKRMSICKTYHINGVCHHPICLRHEMSHIMVWKCFPCHWPFVKGIHQSKLVPHLRGEVMWRFDDFFFCQHE